MFETTDIDEAEIEGKEDCASDQPNYYQLQFGPADRNGRKNEVRQGFRDGSKGCINSVVDGHISRVAVKQPLRALRWRDRA